MKKFLNKIKNIIELSPALAVAMAAILGFQLTTPVLDDVVWPEKPEVQVEAKEKEEKRDDEDEKKEVSQTVGNYKDGIFTGTGIGYGGPMTVQVTVNGGQIIAVEVLDHNETEKFLNLASRGVIEAILTRQTWEVDAVSGATYSSRGIKEGVCNALTGQASTSSTPEKAGPQGAPPANSSFKLGEWADGSYKGTSHGFGGPITVKVEIKNGKIKSIKVLSHSGETASYFNKAKAIIRKILHAQSPNVDTVSGATYSSGGIREAVKNALKKAGRSKSSKIKNKKKKTKDNRSDKKSNPSPEVVVPDGSPADGTYIGTALCQQSGRFSYSVTVTATYKEGKLVDLTMTTTDNGANAKYINLAWGTLKTSLLTNFGGNVDTVTSATYTSNAIKTAYMLAFKAAVEAKGGSLVENPDPGKEMNPGKEEGTDSGLQSGESQQESGQEGQPGSHNGEADLSGTPADGSYPVNVTVNSNDAKNSSDDGWFTSYHLSGTVTFKEGKLTSITNIQVGEDADEYEIEDDDYYTATAADKMVNRLIEKQSNDVDTVSGATCSSKGIIALYEEAFRQAVKVSDSISSDNEEKKEDALPSDTKASKPNTSLSDTEDSRQNAPASDAKANEENPSSSEVKENGENSPASKAKEAEKNSSTSKAKEAEENSSASKVEETTKEAAVEKSDSNKKEDTDKADKKDPVKIEESDSEGCKENDSEESEEKDR